MARSSKWYKEHKTDSVWWLNNGSEAKGEFVFSFDKADTFNLFTDYPWKLTKEQKAVFDKENPYWANFFKDRTKEE